MTQTCKWQKRDWFLQRKFFHPKGLEANWVKKNRETIEPPSTKLWPNFCFINPDTTITCIIELNTRKSVKLSLTLLDKLNRAFLCMSLFQQDLIVSILRIIVLEITSKSKIGIIVLKVSKSTNFCSKIFYPRFSLFLFIDILSCQECQLYFTQNVQKLTILK